jgi:hypothetical protein
MSKPLSVVALEIITASFIPILIRKTTPNIASDL